ncbi:unnamed protein product [Diamesa serratosioi]
MPQWEAIGTAIILTLIIILTIVGNILVILSVFTYKPLRIVQNFFIVSLAVADLTVAILVLPFNVAYSILGRWEFGIHICKMWLTSDVLCCTASILNLCAIALDRYWAITDPINYAQKRTVERVLILIFGVWVLSLLISSPPLIGWNDWPDNFSSDTPCQLTANRGYVIYSSLGSFFIPLIIMTIVYIEIYIATRRRLRERAKASKMNAMALKSNFTTKTIENTPNNNHNSNERERESISSEINQNDAAGMSDDAKTTVIEIDKANIKTKDATSNNNNNNNNNGLQCVKKSATVVYQFIEEKQKISLSKERRAARTLGIIMGVFVVCWLPFFLMYVIVPFCPTCCPTEKLANFITWLGYINSALNPIIYTIFNLDYRRAFKKLLGLKP